MAGSDFESDQQHVDAPNEGAAEMTIESVPVTEREIKEARDQVILRLHMSYLNLTDAMQEFQQEWDKDPAWAMAVAAKDGIASGVSSWLDDSGDLFEKETWVDIGDSIGDFAGNAYDKTSTYAGNLFYKLHAELATKFQHSARFVANADDTLLNWTWWDDKLDATYNNIEQELIDTKNEWVAAGRRTADSVQAFAEDSQHIYRHRQAILDLPKAIANGDVNRVEGFVDTVLMDIDPTLAKSIKESEHWPIVIELINDHESGLAYVTYLSLMLEAIPPNFLAFLAAKYGIYLLIEIVLLVVLAFISVGAGPAARIGMLAARLAATSTKVRRGQAAISAMTRMLDDFAKAAEALHDIGRKLVIARQKGTRVKTSTGTSSTALRQNAKREQRCRMCNDTDHKTPRYKLGTVKYE